MDPQANVTQGEWVTGPDGRRDRDVVVRGSVDGMTRTVLIECKDFDPERTGRVGIHFVDALDSKRRDLDVDAALICSNAGFTADAVRKASRVGIGLIGVMKKGDERVRIMIPEALYTRRVKVESLTIQLHYQGSPIRLNGTRFEAVLYDDLPVGNWVIHRALLLIAANQIVTGTFTASHKLIAPIELELPTGPVTVDRIDFQLQLSGSWYVQEVTFDASTALYDWLRRRVRLAPGQSQFHINDVDINAGDPLDRPPDHVLRTDIRDGEMFVRLCAVDARRAPAGPRP